jgi:hypothetical protein
MCGSDTGRLVHLSHDERYEVVDVAKAITETHAEFDLAVYGFYAGVKQVVTDSRRYRLLMPPYLAVQIHERGYPATLCP